MIKLAASNKIPWLALFLLTLLCTSVLLMILLSNSVKTFYTAESGGIGNNYKILNNFT